MAPGDEPTSAEVPQLPLRVLVADDSALLRRSVRVALDAAPGMEVVGEAVDGVEAVEMTIDLRPQVIVLDQQMPRLTGLSALPQLRAACPDARIVVWSSDGGLAAEALARGADAFVDKAHSLIDLVAEIERYRGRSV